VISSPFKIELNSECIAVAPKKGILAQKMTPELDMRKNIFKNKLYIYIYIPMVSSPFKFELNSECIGVAGNEGIFARRTPELGMRIDILSSVT
jgi:hypothetical protein